jgi:hypothetical protein
VIHIDKIFEQSVFGWLDNEEGSDVDECEDFAEDCSVCDISDSDFKQAQSDCEEEYTSNGLSSDSVVRYVVLRPAVLMERTGSDAHQKRFSTNVELDSFFIVYTIHAGTVNVFLDLYLQSNWQSK